MTVPNHASPGPAPWRAGPGAALSASLYIRLGRGDYGEPPPTDWTSEFMARRGPAAGRLLHLYPFAPEQLDSSTGAPLWPAVAYDIPACRMVHDRPSAKCELAA